MEPFISLVRGLRVAGELGGSALLCAPLRYFALLCDFASWREPVFSYDPLAETQRRKVGALPVRKEDLRAL